MSRHDGKKIDEILLHEGGRITVRYHASLHPRFTVVAAEKDFEGQNLQELLEQAEIHMRGWAALIWEPVIGISTETSLDIHLRYQRFFRTKHKGSWVYRHWKIGNINEEDHGPYQREEHKKTAHRTDGEPGEIERRPILDRILKYTPERWLQVRALDQALEAAMDAVEKKIDGILGDSSEEEFNEFLLKISKGGCPAITFNK